MPLDPNIILSGQQPQLQNPLDMASKAMAFKSLATRSQIEGIQAQQAQQQFNDQNAMRSAYANNTNVDSNGNVNYDRSGIIKDLAINAPQLAAKAQQSFAQMDNEAIKTNLEKVGYAAQMLQGVESIKDPVAQQAAYTQMKNSPLAQAAGSQNWPAQHDPNFVNTLFNQALDHKSQLEAQAKQQGLDLQAKDVDLKKQQLDFDSKKFTATQQQSSLQNTMQQINASRSQTPDVNQAYSDRYNAQKVIDIVHSKDDPNKIDINMVPVIASEVAKIAQGGAPQHEELQSITPQDAANIQARAKQYLSSNPQAGQQGAFLKAYQEYANLIQSHANGVIKNSVGKKIEANKQWLAPNDYQNIKSMYVDNPYGPDSPTSPPATNNQQADSGKSNTQDIHPALTTKKISDEDLLALQKKLSNQKQAVK